MELVLLAADLPERLGVDHRLGRVAGEDLERPLVVLAELVEAHLGHDDHAEHARLVATSAPASIDSATWSVPELQAAGIGARVAEADRLVVLRRPSRSAPRRSGGGGPPRLSAPIPETRRGTRSARTCRSPGRRCRRGSCRGGSAGRPRPRSRRRSPRRPGSGSGATRAPGSPAAGRRPRGPSRTAARSRTPSPSGSRTTCTARARRATSRRGRGGRGPAGRRARRGTAAGRS